MWTVSPMPETESPHFDEITHFLNLLCGNWCKALIVELVGTLGMARALHILPNCEQLSLGTAI